MDPMGTKLRHWKGLFIQCSRGMWPLGVTNSTRLFIQCSRGVWPRGVTNTIRLFIYNMNISTFIVVDTESTFFALSLYNLASGALQQIRDFDLLLLRLSSPFIKRVTLSRAVCQHYDQNYVQPVCGQQPVLWLLWWFVFRIGFKLYWFKDDLCRAHYYIRFW